MVIKPWHHVSASPPTIPDGRVYWRLPFNDRHHPSNIDHSPRDLMAQRIYQIACGYDDGNDANHLRTGKTPSGTEKAMIMKRVLKRLRAAWPDTHIILRGDSHFSNPDLMQLALDDPRTDFIFQPRILSWTS